MINIPFPRLTFKRPGKVPPIVELPTDVLHYLLNAIPATEAAALALTCKAIFNNGGSNILMELEFRDRIGLLQIMEPSYPKQRLCYQCAKFHARKKGKDKEAGNENETECDKKNGRFLKEMKILNIPFTKLQDVEARHRLGKKYGLPICALEMRVQNKDLSERQRTKARIVQGDLFIRLDIWRKYPRAEFERGECDVNAGCRYCPHLSNENLDKSRYIFRKQYKLICETCRMESIFRVKELDASTKQVHTSLWFNLGPCRDPFEKEWRKFAVDSTSHPFSPVIRYRPMQKIKLV